MRFANIDYQKAEKVLRYIVLFFVSLYVINAVGGIEGMTELIRGRRYLNVLWIALGLYLIVSRGKIDWQFFLEYVRIILPIFAVGIFLYFYHSTGFNLSYFKYSFLLILACSVVCTVEGYRLREFFLANSISCLTLFFVATYQICILDYVVPIGAGNQNILASISLILGNISVFSVLYKKPNRDEKFFYLLCGILAIWVALRTTCRTAYVAEGVLLAVFLFWGKTKLHWSSKRVVTIFVFSLILVFLAFLNSPTITEDKFAAIWNEIQQFLNLGDGETTKSSVGLRLAMWEAALVDVIPNHLCFGVGDFRKIYWPKLLVDSSMGREFLDPFYHFHNEGINTLVMGGLLLFVGCNWFLFQLFKIAKHEPVLLGILVGTISWGLTEVAFFHKAFFFVFVSVWLLYECAIKAERKVEERQEAKVESLAAVTSVPSKEISRRSKMKLPISVVLLTHNEEKNIEDCLRSCSFAQEIVVVDDDSTDRTVELAKKFLGVKVYKRSLDGDFGAQKSFAIAKAKKEWIFLIDADERVTPELEEAIRRRVQAGEKFSYLIQRENRFKNIVVRHGVMHPDWVLRLMPQKGASAAGRVHEGIASLYPVKRIVGEGRLIHFPYSTWDQAYAKIDKYSRLSAIKFMENGKPCGFYTHVLLHPIWAFIKIYFFNLGFLDGKAGYIFAANHAVYTLSKYVRYYQLKHFNGEI